MQYNYSFPHAAQYTYTQLLILPCVLSFYATGEGLYIFKYCTNYLLTIKTKSSNKNKTYSKAIEFVILNLNIVVRGLALILAKYQVLQLRIYFVSISRLYDLATQ